MNSKERVKRALNFESPDRIPVFYSAFGDIFPLLAMESNKWQPQEENVYPWYLSPWIRQFKIHRWKRPSWAVKNWWDQEIELVDQWGCYWNRTKNDLTMGHPGRPVIDTWDKLETWEPSPTISDPKTYRLFHWLSKFAYKKYRLAVINSIIFIMNRVSMLRGFTNTLIDHKRNPNQLQQLIDKVTDFLMANIEMVVTKYKPDGVWACDDLGTQEAPFFSPELFKKFYAEPYKRVINYLHDYDCDFHLHSCGNIGDLIPALIDTGLDSLEFDSPRLTGFERLSEYRGKLPFWACVNIQSVYPKGTPEEVEQEVIEMIRTFSTQEGGFLAYFYLDRDVIRIPKQNEKAFKKALKKWGKYPLTVLS